MTKPNTDPAKTPGAGEPGQAPPAAAPEQEAPEISTSCIMCGNDVLAEGSRGFLRVGVQRFVLASPVAGADFAVLLDQPEGESDLVLVCNTCVLNSIWAVTRRAIQVTEQVAEAAAAGLKN